MPMAAWVDMKLAVISDIHGNYPALAAVMNHVDTWHPDGVIVAGDVVNRGPCSLTCLQRIEQRRRESGWQVIRGNHEDYVLEVLKDPSPRPGLEGAVRENVHWTCLQLGDVRAILEAMPPLVQLYGPDGSEVRITHASMRSNRENMFLDTPEELLRQQIAPAPALFCMAHTHRPFVRQIDGTLLVNAGAVGMPFDGDVRASYARLEWSPAAWYAEIVRVDYDRTRTEHDFYTSGYFEHSGPVAALIFREFQSARPCLFTWMERYRAPVLAGEISVEQAVRLHLASLTPAPGTSDQATAS